MAPCCQFCHVSRQSWKMLVLAFAVLGCTVPFAAQAPVLISFEAKDAGRSPNQGTIATCINQSGTVAGQFTDSNYVTHGFVRSPSGQITEFNGTGNQSITVTGINSSGQIIGNTQGVFLPPFSYAFLRNPDGGFVQIHPSGALQTFADGINDGGEITGSHSDIGHAYHGFLRAADGSYLKFDEPDAVIDANGQGTFAIGINANGEIVGTYDDAQRRIHSFTRDRAGNFTSFDAPGAGNCTNCGTLAAAINRNGEVAGNYYSDQSYNTHSFVRDASGNITDFDVPGAIQTYALTIGDAGQILGGWTDGSFWYGFIRDPSGIITTMSGPFAGLYPRGTNDAGDVAGYYDDENGRAHGFLQ